MATVNFSVPDAIKAAFDAAFRGHNKSAVIAALMQRAVAERDLAKRREQLFAALTAGRGGRPAVSGAELRRVRRGERS